MKNQKADSSFLGMTSLRAGSSFLGMTNLCAAALLLIVWAAGCGGNNTYNPNLSGPGVPSFKLTGPASVTIAAGGSSSVTITVKSINGFSSPVDLTAAGLPSGATGVFAPTSV